MKSHYYRTTGNKQPTIVQRQAQRLNVKPPCTRIIGFFSPYFGMNCASLFSINFIKGNLIEEWLLRDSTVLCTLQRMIHRNRRG